MQRLFIIFFCITANLCSFAQDSTAIKPPTILVDIEDSLRDQLIAPYDSSWLNDNLLLQNSIYPLEKTMYRLVKITEEGFTEGPLDSHSILSENDTTTIIQTPSFGDLTYQMNGIEKFYTYTGNSSWGFYYVYHFERVYPTLDLDIELNLGGYCKHGWDQLRGLACPACMYGDELEEEFFIKKKE